MKVEMSLGDVVDRVTILLIKQERFDDPDKLANVRNELAALRSAWSDEGQPPMEQLSDWAALRTVNEQLWDVEDRLREHERAADFGADFVALARSVYHLNDRRAARKRAINTALGSRLVEEKSYVDYGDGAGVPGLG